MYRKLELHSWESAPSLVHRVLNNLQNRHSFCEEIFTCVIHYSRFSNLISMLLANPHIRSIFLQCVLRFVISLLLEFQCGTVSGAWSLTIILLYIHIPSKLLSHLECNTYQWQLCCAGRILLSAPLVRWGRRMRLCWQEESLICFPIGIGVKMMFRFSKGSRTLHDQQWTDGIRTFAFPTFDEKPTRACCWSGFLVDRTQYGHLRVQHR